MVQLNPYLTFDGTCAEAMRFYETTLGGKIEMMMTAAQAPMSDQMPPGSGDRIMHARMLIDGQALMAADAMSGQPYQPMGGFSLSLTYPTAAEGKKIFEALSAGGKITMPIQQTFWIEAFGMLVDRFGTPWMVNAGEPVAM